MTRRWTSILLGLILFVPATASAQQLVPDPFVWGVGANTTLGGVNGLAVRTFFTDDIAGSLTAGFDFESQTIQGVVGDDVSTDTIFELSLYGSYKLKGWDQGHLSAMLGLDFASISGRTDFADPAVTDFSGSATNVQVGLGVQGEWFVTKYMSIYLQGGIRVDIINDDQQLRNQSQTTFTINTTGEGPNGFQFTSGPSSPGLGSSDSDELFGGAGFSIWFQP